ncbi:MAG: SGNH/GDSL hydrolase family protein [Clostridia bacterium]|nr:SGNH/GDSL hydrolase family protein [Clostridia bacterium]
MLTGKKLSILGDSVSTYRGVSNDRYANATIWGNRCFYDDPFPLEKTYWSLVMNEFGMELCVNNSWSGGNLTGRDIEAAGVNRVNFLSRDDGTNPDFIIFFMGINDLGRGVDSNVFAEDYEKVLETMKWKYPNAYVCCINMPDRYEYLRKRTLLFNEIIENAVKKMNDEKYFVADLYHSEWSNENYEINTVDLLHPDEDGMRMIAKVVIDAIKENIK